VPPEELPPPQPLAAAEAARRQNRMARLRMIVRAGGQSIPHGGRALAAPTSAFRRAAPSLTRRAPQPVEISNRLEHFDLGVPSLPRVMLRRTRITPAGTRYPHATKGRAAGKGRPHAVTYREVDCLLTLDRLIA
jgi:hypothetical protein